MTHYEIHREQSLDELKAPQVIRFASRSEMAAGLLLEKYIPNFHLSVGETMQVPIGLNKVCDFKVNDVFLEYHPMNLHFEFDDRQALRQLKAACRHVKKPFRDQIYEAIKAELSEKYFRRRKMLISMHTGDPACELIVAQDASDLYRQVIKRFALEYPKERAFVREFEILRDSSDGRARDC